MIDNPSSGRRNRKSNLIIRQLIQRMCEVNVNKKLKIITTKQMYI